MNIPYDLKELGEVRLKALGVDTLRSLCEERNIDVFVDTQTDQQKEQTGAYVRKLLAWKGKESKRRAANEQRTRERPAGAVESPSTPEAVPRSSSRRHGGNINVISRCSSHRLAQVLEPRVADLVIYEREINGEYTDWQSLRYRVNWLLDEDIKALVDEGFSVSVTARGTNSANDAQEPTRAHLRENVTRMAEPVWRHRQGIDMYTRCSRSIVEEHSVQVDHVLELQLLENCREAAYSECDFRVTRAMERGFSKLVNGMQNLNVTRESLNQIKKGPFRAWLMQAEGGECASLEELARRSRLGRQLVDEGTWRRIQDSCVQVWEELHIAKESMQEQRYCEVVLDRCLFAMDKMQLFS